MTPPPSSSAGANGAAAPLDVFFRPRSIAVIGASRDADSMGGTLWRNIVGSFRGPLYAVNPRAADIDGHRTYASVLDVPGEVDLAFIIVPAARVIDVARECLQKGVRGLVVNTAGFSETGAAGRERQAELQAVLKGADVRLIGPNCLGVLNTDPADPLNGTFSLPQSPAGNVAVCTQSGALGFVFPESMRRWNVGISQLVSIGNKLDVGENDLLEQWAHDDRTDVIQLYLESFQKPCGFLEVARRVSQSKPIVALKAGRSAAGERAAGSHTAALASPAAAADGLFRQAGVIAVDSLAELFETTALLALQPLPRGRRVAVLTNAGGPGVLCADALESGGLILPEFSEELQTRLREFLPAEATVRNPIDLIGATDPAQFRRCLEILLPSDEIDALIVIYVPRLEHTTAAVAAAVTAAAARDDYGKPLLAVYMEARSEPERELGRVLVRSFADVRRPNAPQIPCYLFPEEAARALRRAVEYADRRNRPDAKAAGTERIPQQAAGELRRLFESSRSVEPRWLSVREVLRVLECCGLPTPAWSICRNEDEALAAAAMLGFPVVVKALSPTVLHKSDVGGVLLDLRNPDELRAACRTLRERVPDAAEWLVQRFVNGGIETLVGVRRDPQFGHLIGFGVGGVLVEALRDVQFRLHPLTEDDAADLIRNSLAVRLFPGHRGRPPSDVAALRAALLRTSALLDVLPQISQLDLNPLSILPNGQGVCVLDARIQLIPPTGEASDTRP